MKEVNLTEFTQHTLTIVKRLAKLCQGAYTDEGGKVVTDCLFFNRTYFYTYDKKFYSSLDCLVGASKDQHRPVMAASIRRDGSWSQDYYYLIDPLRTVCTKLTPAIYERRKTELEVFFSLRFAITYYDHEHGFHTLTSSPHFHALTVFSIEHLHNMLLNDLHDMAAAMHNYRNIKDTSFTLLGSTITLHKDEIMYGLMNSLLSSDRYMKYIMLTVIETCAGAKKRTTIFQTYIELILIQLFDYQLSYDELELAFLPSNTKEFFAWLSRQYQTSEESINYMYEQQMQYIQEGFIKAIYAFWQVDLETCAKKEQNLKKKGLFSYLETESLSPTEERTLVYTMLSINPANPVLLNYLCASHPEEIENLQRILYFFHLPQPTPDLIHSTFCNSLFPEAVQMLGIQGITGYIESLSTIEILKLQKSITSAQKKYHYSSHDLVDTVNLLIEERMHGQNHYS